MATAFLGVAAVAATLAVGFTALEVVAAGLAAGLATTLAAFATAVDFTAVAAFVLFVLFADAAGVFAGFFIAFAIESTAN
ncbi:hypothetical protein [Herbaspirillum sp.]|uniref:hypothetical protein n=1 Tax=Herbaspirillum sp. TaxID=1890675 RepID=UPI0025BD9A37|nr:hypothetical protein [Herbaspirillum sp.]